MYVVGEKIRITSPHQHTAFQGRRGEIVAVTGETLVVQLIGYPVPVAFGPSEVSRVAVPTARVGAHFPGEEIMCDFPRLASERPHRLNSRAGCPNCYVPGAEKGD